MKKLFIIAVVIGLAVTAFAMSDLYVSGDWHYKMTVTVDTPEGIKTGEVVREITDSDSKIKIDLPNATSPAKVRGEAVVIDLGNNQYLFGLVSWDAFRELYKSFPYAGPESTIEGVNFYNSLPIGSKAELPREAYPRFVTFKDIDNPTSVEAVDIDNLSEKFGESVKIQTITIELVDEPVTQTIKELLPWLNDYYNQRLDGQRFGTSKAENRTANSLSSGAFSTEGPNNANQ